MTIDHLRFPSGTTVDQAKKDAKRLAREQDIPLHHAQEQIARQNGLNLPWAKAIEWIQQRPKPLVTFRLPLDPKRNANATTHLLDVYETASTLVIAGIAGTGKTVLALELANQALSAGTTAVHYCSSADALRVLKLDDPLFHLNHLASFSFNNIRRRFPQTFHAHDFKSDDAPMNLNVSPGSLVIVDELFALKRSRLEIIAWAHWAKSQHCALLLIGQSLTDVFPSQLTGRENELIACLGGMFLGRLDTTEAAPEKAREFLKLTETLGYEKGGGSEWVAFSAAPAWLGILKFKKGVLGPVMEINTPNGPVVGRLFMP